MKNRVSWLMVPAIVLGLAACKKKEESKTPETPVAVESPVQAPPTAPPIQSVALSPDERATKLGFVKYLPQDTEVAMAFHNGTKSAKRIKASKLWKLVQSEMGMGPDELDSADADVEPEGPAALFGSEFTIALGNSCGEQTANLLTLNRRMSYFQMRMLAKALVEASASGDISAMEAGLATSYPDLFSEILADSESGVDLLEKLRMPPLYLAFRASPSGLDAAAQQIASLTENLSMLGDMVVPATVESAGKTFTGHKISGGKISDFLAEGREEMEEMLDPSSVDRLLAAVAKRDLVVLSGTLGDYVVLFIGASVDDLKFAPDIKQSLVGSDALAFCDPYVSKELAAVIYGQKDMLDLLAKSAGGLSDMTDGLRDGLSGTDALGDTRDLETLLRMVGEREAVLRSLIDNEALGAAAFFEDGLKIESFGGSDYSMIDWKTPNNLASLGDSEDVVMFANMTTDAAYDEKARAYIEALMETAYAMAMKVSEIPIEDEEMAQYQEMAKMFDTQFRPDVVAMWDSFSENFGGSLGSERALVIDLKGSVPTVPGIPQAIVDDGKFPRISMVAPVTDRSKLTDSWDQMNSSLTDVLGKVSEMTGQEIPMQKPISSEKDGYTTWFFSMPFFNDDFMPSVTVGDKWFAASSSKNQAVDLMNQAAAGGEARTGFRFTMNFKALEKFSEEMIEVLGKDPDALGLSNENLKDALQAAKTLDDLDKLTIHARREGGVLRSSVHFKTR